MPKSALVDWRSSRASSESCLHLVGDAIEDLELLGREHLGQELWVGPVRDLDRLRIQPKDYVTFCHHGSARMFATETLFRVGRVSRTKDERLYCHVGRATSYNREQTPHAWLAAATAPDGRVHTIGGHNQNSAGHSDEQESDELSSITR